MPLVKPSLFERVKSIRMPVFQLIFYSSLGYLGYIFYQDYRYKQLVQEIQQRSSKQKVINPLRKVTQIVKRMSDVEGKRQLKVLLKDLELVVERYWVDPKRREDIIDFQMKELQKAEDDKKIWWTTPYSIYAKLMTSIYRRCDIMKQGTFGLFFWSNYKVEEKNELLQCKSINALIAEAVKIRRKKCEDIAINHSLGRFQHEDREILQCLSQTSREVSSLEKMMARIELIGENQLLR